MEKQLYRHTITIVVDTYKPLSEAEQKVFADGFIVDMAPDGDVVVSAKLDIYTDPVKEGA